MKIKINVAFGEPFSGRGDVTFDILRYFLIVVLFLRASKKVDVDVQN